MVQKVIKLLLDIMASLKICSHRTLKKGAFYEIEVLFQKDFVIFFIPNHFSGREEELYTQAGCFCAVIFRRLK